MLFSINVMFFSQKHFCVSVLKLWQEVEWALCWRGGMLDNDLDLAELGLRT